ncbi:MAG: alpha/beta hydrolase-fold protein, partial [Pseudomonadota bacterium]
MAASTHRLLFMCLATLAFSVAGCGPQTGNADADGDRAISSAADQEAPRFEVTIAAGPENVDLDGRLLLILASEDEPEPRFQTSYRFDGPQIFGMNVQGARLGDTLSLDDSAVGYPIRSLADVPPGTYTAQAVFNRYDDYTLANGKTVSLPASWAAGQNWRREPGNLVSTPKPITISAGQSDTISLAFDNINPEITPPADTEYIKHVEIVSERLSAFWGREMKLGAHVLLPHGYEDNPDARYPLIIFHGHYAADFGGFRPEPPDPDLACEYSARFDLDCYNRTVQEEAHTLYKDWISEEFPRVIIIEVQHANPYYDDSYAVNSANLGPYGDAITYELVPFIEETFRGLGEPWARFMYGGSTGGWEAMAAQVFYPDDYNGAYIACPDPIDFRAYMSINIYEDDNAYYREGTFGRILRPGHRNYLGHLNATIKDFSRYESALGDKNRSGDQFDIWEAVYSPMGDDGYPRQLWDRETGKIDQDVAA